MDIVIKQTQIDCDTLAALTALLWDTTMVDFKEAILLKQVITEVNSDWANVTADSVLAGLAYGDATIAQIAAAITAQVTDTENNQAYREGQTAVRAIIDLRALTPAHTGGETQAQTIEWRLPKKGLPASRGSGFQTFVFNPTSTAHANGPVLRGATKWLFARLGGES